MALTRAKSSVSRAAAVALGLVLTAGSAWADAIDGEWCREGRHFVIEGPNIVTYAGTRMTGDYDRHGFRYTVPAGEPEAGREIVMVLLSEETLELFRKTAGAPAGASGTGEIWKRCRVTS